VSVTLSSVDDLQLLQRIGKRDQHAVLLLYQKYGDLVFSLALRVLREPGLAEEVTQDIFVKVWRQPDRWDPALGQFSSWLLTITRNAAIDRLRAEQRQPGRRYGVHHLSEETTAPLASDEPDWLDGQLLRRLLNQLPPEQRTLIELAYFMGFTHSELADRLQIPLGTVKTRIRTGLQKLRALWHESGAD
jgi:RNA polymerase sigma-70 factor (ECF subfamily)